MQSYSGGLKVGVFVDVANIYLNGGSKWRADVLRQYAHTRGVVLRLNAYVSYDADRARTDREYGDRAREYHNVLRDMGYHTTVREVRWFFEPETSRRFGKADVDLEIGIDLLLQSRNLDLVLLVTGDGDFVKAIQAVRDTGCRVEVIAFENVSQALRREADIYMSGFLIPELLPTNRPGEEAWGEVGSTVRGVCYAHPPDESYGFLSFLTRLSPNTWITDPRNADSPYRSVFFHDSTLPADVSPRQLPSRHIIFEFEIGEAERGLFAENLRVVSNRA